MYFEIQFFDKMYCKMFLVWSSFDCYIIEKYICISRVIFFSWEDYFSCRFGRIWVKKNFPLKNPFWYEWGVMMSKIFGTVIFVLDNAKYKFENYKRDNYYKNYNKLQKFENYKRDNLDQTLFTMTNNWRHNSL